MKSRDEILKAQEDRMNNINDSFNNPELKKAKEMPIGSVAMHGGKKMKKVGPKKWEPVKGEGKSEGGSKGDLAKFETKGGHKIPEKLQDGSKKPSVFDFPPSTRAEDLKEMSDAYAKVHGKDSFGAKMMMGLSNIKEQNGNTRAAGSDADKNASAAISRQTNFKDDKELEERKPEAENKRGDLSQTYKDFSAAMKKRIADPENPKHEKKVRNLIEKVAVNAGMSKEEAKSIPWTEDDTFGGGSKTSVEAAVKHLKEMHKEIKQDNS